MVSEAAVRSERCNGNAYFSGSSRSSMLYFRIMLVLSISLFWLLFLEVALWNRTNKRLHSFTRTAMWIGLWTDSIFITFVIPAIIGSNFLKGIMGSKRSKSQQKNLLTGARTARLFSCSINRNCWLPVMGSVLGIYGSATIFHFLDAIVVVTMSQTTAMESTSLSNSLLARLISRICAFGLAISSAMNGFGSVSLPYTFLVGFLYEPISPKHLANVQEELESIKAVLQLHQYQQNRCSNTSANRSNKIKSKSTWFDSSATTTSNGTGTLIRRSAPCTKPIVGTSPDYMNSNNNPNYHHKSNTFHAHSDTVAPSNRELATMEELYDDLTTELEEMRCIARASASSTNFLCSRYLFRTLGLIFSVVLMLRLCLSSISIISFSWKSYRTVKKYSLHYGSSPESLDPITRALTWLAGYNLVNVTQFHNISQGCTLILTFVLSYTQVGNFLFIAYKLNKKIYSCSSCIVSRPKCQEVEEFIQLSDSTKQYTCPHYRILHPNVTSIIMGSYFLSCLVVIGTTLPEEYRAPLIYALHGATFSFHPFYFDFIYTLSATITLVLFASITGIRRQNSLNRYLNEELIDSTAKELRHLENVC